MLALIVLATAFSAVGSQADELPTLSDVAKAYTDFSNEPCLVTIDICAEVGDWWSPADADAEDIKDLRCRRTGRSKATCTFEVGNERCKGRFARRENVTEALWGLRRDRKAGFSLMMRCRPLS